MQSGSKLRMHLNLISVMEIIQAFAGTVHSKKA